jgi:hypothetical protein
MLSVPDVAAGARNRAENTIPAAMSHDICLGPALFARARLRFHAMPQFHLMPQYPQTLRLLDQIDRNLTIAAPAADSP